MNNQSIEILNAIVNNNILSNRFDKRLVITENRSGVYNGNLPGSYLSFKDLTAEDFFEVCKYKKSLEEKER